MSFSSSSIRPHFLVLAMAAASLAVSSAAAHEPFTIQEYIDYLGTVKDKTLKIYEDIPLVSKKGDDPCVIGFGKVAGGTNTFDSNGEIECETTPIETLDNVDDLHQYCNVNNRCGVTPAGSLEYWYCPDATSGNGRVIMDTYFGASRIAHKHNKLCSDADVPSSCQTPENC